MEEIKNGLSRRSFVAGAAATGALAAMGLAGCSGSKSSDTSSDSSSDSSDTSGEAKSGGTITAACGYSSTSYNPIGNSSALVLGAIWHVHEGLYEIDLTDYSVYNALAAGDPTQVSDTEYEVTLRDGAKFSDGNPVTADDVVNAFNENMANDTYGPFLEFIDSVAAKDDATITFTLKYPFDSLLTKRLACVKVFPASQTAADWEAGTLPIGSGPWAYCEGINGDDGGSIDFVPNEYYNGPKTVSADKMHWDVLKDDTSRTTALQDGSVMVMENVPAANVEQLQAAGATVDYVQGFSLPFFMFNCQKAPFNDARVRQAFFYAIDMDKLIENTQSGHAAAVKSFLPENHANFHEASTVYTYDPDKAASLLKEAGAEGLEFELMCNNNWVQALSAQIKEDLDAVGMNCTLNVTTIDWASLAPSDSDAELPYDVMLTPGDPSCFGNDPDLLMSWWYADNVWTQGRSCWKKAGDGKFDEFNELLTEARQADAADQQTIWNDCFDMLSEEVPIYPLFHRQLATGYYCPPIQGFEPIGTTGLVFLNASVSE